MNESRSVTADGASGPLPVRRILREWGRIGCLGFGGPPAHIALFRELCVQREGWIEEDEFEHAIAVTNLLPGPASTQLAIYCAWSLRGLTGALAGGLAFILPGLVLIIALAAVFLGSPPEWVVGLGVGAGAVVPAVAVQAAAGLIPASWKRAAKKSRQRWVAYVLAGAATTVLVGAWVVIALIACGAVEMICQRKLPAWMRPVGRDGVGGIAPVPVLAAVLASGGMAALCWTAFKVGALSYGGGFVIIPMMQADAVDRYHWMTSGEFLNAVALGQATPGPVVQTVSVVGFAAHGLAGALVAAVVAFAPSFWFIGLGAKRFDRLRTDPSPRAFLDGAGPAAIGAILGVAIPLTVALGEPWQFMLLALGAVALLLLRVAVIPVILAGASAGAAAALLGAPLPS
ncbi:MAG: chromate efflux transporter [Solirubrobacterales bacterium]|nr:chromate efflux transporter [Solirubrobacterales bacterium]MCB8915184.1 chromate efflux transporter [Thermoleophilales bacterium]